MGFISFAPNLIIAIIVFIIGWMVGSLVGKAIAQVVNALKIDKLFESAGAGEIMQRMGMKLSVGGFLGGLVKWFIIVVFLMTSLEFLRLSQVNDFLREVVLGYLPNVIIAALILIIASVVADAMKKIISGSAKAANVHLANLMGSVARYAIWIFAFIIALSELGIATAFMQVLFTGLIAMLAIAGGLAFGLGGKDAAARFIERMKNEMSSR
jgi:small-conductance mechanosensitive channel